MANERRQLRSYSRKSAESALSPSSIAPCTFYSCMMHHHNNVIVALVKRWSDVYNVYKAVLRFFIHVSHMRIYAYVSVGEYCHAIVCDIVLLALFPLPGVACCISLGTIIPARRSRSRARSFDSLLFTPLLLLSTLAEFSCASATTTHTQARAHSPLPCPGLPAAGLRSGAPSELLPAHHVHLR